MAKIIENFLEVTRAYSLPISVTPFLIAFACALKAPFIPDSLFFINSFLILLGVITVHLLGNLFDDFIDVKNALKRGEKLSEINFKNKNKAKLIINGTYSITTIEKILLVMAAVALLIGAHFVTLRGLEILLYIFITGLLSLIYPISSRYGLAELIIAVIFGPLLINASYYALCGQYDPQVFNFSIASGILTSILLLTHSVMDFEFDTNTGKNTIPVLLKSKYLAINFISALILIAYGILIYTSVKYNISKLILLPILLTSQIALKLILSLYDYIEVKDVELQPKWYFGAMENFEEIKRKGIQYFMYRFYLARNLGAIFNFLLALCALFAFVPFSYYQIPNLHLTIDKFIY